MAFKAKSILPMFFGLLCLSCITCTFLGRCSSREPTLTATRHDKEGTGVYLLLDVSGSMDSSVPNDKGQNESKISIAKRSAIGVCTAVDSYAKENQARMIQMAIASFSDTFTLKYPMGKPDLPAMTQAINSLQAGGGTAIGDAVINAQKALDQTGLKSQHILIITDGENNSGFSPEDVAKALGKLPKEAQPSVYVIAFDVNADVFNAVKAQGWNVFSAKDGTQLKAQLDEVVGLHILIEQ